MKFDQFKSPQAAFAILEDIRRTVTRSWTIMEVCGGQTHAIINSGIDQLLPPEVRLVHGPGCPVCVTPTELIDQAIAYAKLPNTVLASFGDMLRVPGSHRNLFETRADGGRVEIVGSALEALAFARNHRDLNVIFFAVGFETTAPSTAIAARQAVREELTNFSILSAHVLVTPAMVSLVSGPSPIVKAYLAAGHVATVMGAQGYEILSRDYKIPVVITGFDLVDLLLGIRAAVHQLERGTARVENMYARVVRDEGNCAARELLEEIFQPEDRVWRGIGMIPQSGLRLRDQYAHLSPTQLSHVQGSDSHESADCCAGEILQGKKSPLDCPLFGNKCDPVHPLGAPMVSSEGACSAYFTNHRRSLHVANREASR